MHPFIDIPGNNFVILGPGSYHSNETKVLRQVLDDRSVSFKSKTERFNNDKKDSNQTKKKFTTLNLSERNYRTDNVKHNKKRKLKIYRKSIPLIHCIYMAS